MTTSFKNRLLICRPFIVKNLGSVDDVIDVLLSEGVLTASANEDLKSHQNDSSKIRKLLDILGRKSLQEFNHFCSALNSTGNEHIASMLSSSEVPCDNNKQQLGPSPNSRKTIMNDKDKNILRRLRVQFVKNMIDVEGVIDILFSEDIIKESHTSSILKHPERSNRVRNLLDILAKRCNNTMTVFLKALKETDNTVLVNKITEHRCLNTKSP